MKRELKKGESFKTADGEIIVRDRDTGDVTVELRGKVRALRSPIIEITEEEFQRDITRWVLTIDEIEAIKEKHMDREKAYYARFGMDVPEVTKKILDGAPVNKMMHEAYPQKKAPAAPGCPECGGPKQGRGFRHSDECSMKSARVR